MAYRTVLGQVIEAVEALEKSGIAAVPPPSALATAPAALAAEPEPMPELPPVSAGEWTKGVLESLLRGAKEFSARPLVPKAIVNPINAALLVIHKAYAHDGTRGNVLRKEFEEIIKALDLIQERLLLEMTAGDITPLSVIAGQIKQFGPMLTALEATLTGADKETLDERARLEAVLTQLMSELRITPERSTASYLTGPRTETPQPSAADQIRIKIGKIQDKLDRLEYGGDRAAGLMAAARAAQQAAMSAGAGDAAEALKKLTETRARIGTFDPTGESTQEVMQHFWKQYDALTMHDKIQDKSLIAVHTEYVETIKLASALKAKL
jgi:hypothetical protein